MIIFATVVVALVLGGAYYMLVMKKPKISGRRKILLLIRPGDRRGMEIPIVKETASWLYCKTVEDVPRRFMKVGPGYVFPDNIIRFLAIEGVGYTADAKINEGDNVQTTTIDKALRALWEDKRYEGMPKDLRKMVEDSKWGFSVEVEAIESTELQKIKSEEANREKDDENVLRVLADAADEANKKKSWDMNSMLIGGSVGALVTYLAVNQGWIRVAHVVAVAMLKGGLV